MTKTSLRVALIEDNPDHAILITRILEQMKDTLTVKRFPDAATFLSYIKRSSPSSALDLVFLDLKLPGMSGFELLRYLKQHRDLRKIPVAVLTTSAIERDKEQALLAGADYYLVKSADFDELYHKLQNVLAQLLKRSASDRVEHG